jgi:cysteine desulfuration protein SufE
LLPGSRSGRPAAYKVGFSLFFKLGSADCFFTMTLSQKQQAFINRYSVIPDSQERLAALIARKSTLPHLDDSGHIDANLVQGCVSRVWLVGSFDGGRCHFRMDADSPMVKGLVAALCELYNDALPAEVASVEPEFFETLGIAKNLTPTRQNGLASVRRTIREFAIHCLASAA